MLLKVPDLCAISNRYGERKVFPATCTYFQTCMVKFFFFKPTKSKIAS